MMTALQSEANRRNARHSTGAKTVAGKSRAAQNARCHGLSISILTDPARFEQIKAMAREIVGRCANSEVQELACRIVEAQVDLLRVRQARHELIARCLNNPNYQSRVIANANLNLLPISPNRSGRPRRCLPTL